MTMRTMTSPALSRIMLNGPPRTEREPKIRRYRLARLKLVDADERAGREMRYAYLKRVYD